jgi:hypothetical protein
MLLINISSDLRTFIKMHGDVTNEFEGLMRYVLEEYLQYYHRERFHKALAESLSRNQSTRPHLERLFAWNALAAC